MVVSEFVLAPALCKGMLHGYADGNHVPGKIDQLPKAKVTAVVIDGITITDCWQTTPLTRKSWGTTTLSTPEGIVWMMQYSGEYPDEVIPFLREALSAAYKTGIFMGGRGPYHYTNGKLTYVNIPTRNDFDDFEGIEQIVDDKHNVLGCHRYHGMSTQ